MSDGVDPARWAEVKKIRTFESGATRDSDKDKPDYEGFFSPLVIVEFGRYMHKHRVQSDGSLRDSDNWQKGMPLAAYMKSMWRHFLDLWLLHRNWTARPGVTLREALCGIIFNAMGYLHELLKKGEQDTLHREIEAEGSGCGDPFCLIRNSKVRR